MKRIVYTKIGQHCNFGGGLAKTHTFTPLIPYPSIHYTRYEPLQAYLYITDNIYLAENAIIQHTLWVKWNLYVWGCGVPGLDSITLAFYTPLPSLD